MPRKGYVTITISADARLKLEALRQLLTQLKNQPLTLSQTIEEAYKIIISHIQRNTQPNT
jgi:hypothetical protein